MIKNLNSLVFTVLALFLFQSAALLKPVLAEKDRNAINRLKLGIIVPTTGPLAFFGNDFIRAYQIASEQNDNINKNIEFFWEDSAYDSKQAITAFNKLVSVDRVDIILSFGGPMLSALAPLAEAKEIPFFATESAKNDCENRKYCSLFRNEEDEWGKATWNILNEQGLKKVGIVKNQNQFMNTFVNAIERTRPAKSSLEILVDAPPDMVDFRTAVLNFKNKDLDAIGVYLLPASHHGFLTALKSINKKVILFGVEEFLVKEQNQGFESLIPGTYVIAPAYKQNYRDEFERRYGFSGGFFYTPAFYDFLNLLSDVSQNNPDYRKLALVEAMRFKGNRKGVSGNYKVVQSSDGVYSYSFPIAVYKLNDDLSISIEKTLTDL